MKHTFFLSLTFLYGLLFAYPQTTSAFTSEGLARAIQGFFPNAPEMVAVARCESGLRQNNENGSALRGGAGGQMIGLFQLHESYHREPARALGYNIDTLVGNLSYARELYRSEGLTPWRSSKHCWGVETGGKATASISKTLRYGTHDSEVTVLQEVLQTADYGTNLTESEPSYFGVQTYKALIALQCEKGIACLRGTGSQHGLGVVDARTRAVINSYLGVTS